MATDSTLPILYGVEDVMEEPPVPEGLAEIIENDNVAEILEENELTKVAEDVCQGVEDDKKSMDDYRTQYEDALKLARMKWDSEESKDFPFQGASKVMMPYLMDAALEFNARFTVDILGSDEIARAEIIGRATQTKEEQAKRVTDALNADLTQCIPEWRPQTDQATFHLPITGMYFRKIYQCPTENRRKCDLLFSDQLIYDHDAESFEKAPRKSFEFTLTMNDVVTKIRSGEYLDMDLSQYATGEAIRSGSILINFIECHCSLDLDDDGYAEPYIVIVEADKRKVVQIQKRFDAYDLRMTEEGDEVMEINGEKFFRQTIFIPDPEKPAVGLGYGILMADMFKTLNTMTRQMIDAGTLANSAANSGFIRKGAKLGGRAGNRDRGGAISMVMGQLTKIETSGNNPLKDDIVQLPFKGGAEGMSMMLQELKSELRIMVQTSQAVDQPNPGEAAALYVAKLAEAHKKQNSIELRVYGGIGGECERIHELQSRYLTDDQYIEILGLEPQFDPIEVQQFQKMQMAYAVAQQNGEQMPRPVPPQKKPPQVDIRTDFSNKYVFQPVANPALGSEQERIARAQVMADRATLQGSPINRYEAEKALAEEMGCTNVEELLPPPDPNAVDPMTQIQMQMVEIERLKVQLDAQKIKFDAVKGQAEIEKIESETVKNYSDADKARVDNSLKVFEAIGNRADKLAEMTQRKELSEDGTSDAVRGTSDQTMAE